MQEVHKFGGAIVGKPDGITQIVKIVEGRSDRQLFVILSAAYGVTDLLIEITNESLDHHKIEDLISNLRDIHCTLLKNINMEVHEPIEQLLHHLKKILNGVVLVGKFNQNSSNLILSFGEKLAVQLIQAQLRFHKISSVILKPENLFLCTGEVTDSHIDFANSHDMVAKVLEKKDQSMVYLIPGYYGQNKVGETTLFGRSGSDYTATSIANLFDIEEVYIWKDVSGFMTSDPKIVSNAKTIKDLTYDQAIDLSAFGAQILQAKASLPTRKKQIPIKLANIQNHHQVTKIHDFNVKSPKTMAITNLNQVVVITLNSLKSNYFVIQYLLSDIIKQYFDKIVFVQSNHSSAYLILKKHSTKFKQRLMDVSDQLELDVTIIEGRALITLVGALFDDIPDLEPKINQLLHDNSIKRFSPFLKSGDTSIGFLVLQATMKKTVKLLHDKFV